MSLQILFSKQLEIDYTNDSQIDCKVLTKQRFQNFFLFDNAKIKEYIYLNPTYTRTFYIENSRSKAYNRSILYAVFCQKIIKFNSWHIYHSLLKKILTICTHNMSIYNKSAI